MIGITQMAGQQVAVFGLGQSGLSAVRALAAGAADVRAWDDDDERRQTAAAAGVPLAEPGDLNWSEISALVLSPGVPLSHPEPHPVVKRARAAGTEVIGDVELFARRGLPARVAAITGTNGKSTTTALAGFVLEACGQPVAIGGNIGTPVLDLPELDADGTYVLEMSSYQIDLAPSLAADVAVLLNLSPDHLDRHGGWPGYVAAKLRLFDQQRPGQTAIVGIDDNASADLFERLNGLGDRTVVPISAHGAAPALRHGVAVVAAQLNEAGGVATADLGEARALKGIHNWQNAAAAFAVVRALGCPGPDAARSLLEFPGLAHRMEDLGVIGGVRFINDSKATNAEAAARALACFEHIHWIAGGRPKAGGYDALEPYLERLEQAYLIGEAADELDDWLGGRVPSRRCGDLASAVAAARSASSGATVLLSPACASFDQFANFEVRGEAFRELVAAGGIA
ncbi:MAG: UDP-N-acetylmuramoyl-L-alanine--D-glutamate ligase [Alphaproteobacteria bacterium]|jgi:UDP-N-acetylmuramoylalanine--D-glutamate ligase|nr:UDP-N-acetylmuramoyl-L-alanine--D-glutamate ligase [Alphaproteobacteria bacterium]